jgi:hypothetical protein
MDKDKRAEPRLPASIHMDCAAAAEGSLHLRDLSVGGFLARGSMRAQAGDTLSGTIHVYPASGERDVTLLGRVMHVHLDDDTTVLGVHIEGFGSLAEKASYLEFVRELAEDS